jgi:hypothetical protein
MIIKNEYSRYEKPFHSNHYYYIIIIFLKLNTSKSVLILSSFTKKIFKDQNFMII